MWVWLRCKAPHLTRFFCHRYCRRSTRVFTINMQGTQAKAMMTSSDWMTICKCNKEKRQKNVKKRKTKIRPILDIPYILNGFDLCFTHLSLLLWSLQSLLMLFALLLLSPLSQINNNYSVIALYHISLYLYIFSLHILLCVGLFMYSFY